MSKETGGPAFPHAELRSPTFDDKGGMTLRDHFAAAVAEECLRVSADQTPSADPLLSELFGKAATYAYFYADAMLAERSKP